MSKENEIWPPPPLVTATSADLRTPPRKIEAVSAGLSAAGFVLLLLAFYFLERRLPAGLTGAALVKLSDLDFGYGFESGLLALALSIAGVVSGLFCGRSTAGKLAVALPLVAWPSVLFLMSRLHNGI